MKTLFKDFSFSAVIADVEKGEHELRIAVDNTFGEHSALHIPNDYYTYGGITRPAAVEYIPDTYIKNIRFNTWLNRFSDALICDS